MATNSTTMSTREFLEAAISANVSPEFTAKAKDLLTKHDARNAARRAKPTKTQVQNEPIVNAIMSALTDSPQLTTEITAIVSAAMSDPSIKSQKVSGLLTNLLKAGSVSQIEVPVKGKGKQKAWFIPTTTSD